MEHRGIAGARSSSPAAPRASARRPRAMLVAGGGSVVDRRSRSDGGALARELGDAARFVRTDVTDEAQRAGRGRRLRVGLRRRRTALVNCAGIVHGEKVVGKEGPHPLASFARAININLIGTFNVMRLAAGAMAKSEPNAERRARRDRQHRVGRRVRRADRPGRVRRVEGRRGRHDAADRARARALRHPRDDDRARASSTRRC